MSEHYLPTRADHLQPGDVVRNPYYDVDASDFTVEAYREFATYACLYGSGGEVFKVKPSDLLDKRISDEEHKALSAPGDW